MSKPSLGSILEEALKTDEPIQFARTLFHVAAEKKDALAIDILSQANVNAESGWGETALHVAADGGCTDTVKALLRAGAQVNLKSSNDGAAALHRAANEGHTGVVKILIAAKAEVDLKDEAGKAALHHVAEKIDDEALKQLLDAGASADLTDKNNETALHLAAFERCETSVKILLNAKASVSMRNNIGQTALHKVANAYEGEGNDTAEALLRAGADIHARDNKGDTPLHCLVRNHGYGGLDPSLENLILALFFIKKGVDIEVLNNALESPYDYVMKSRDKHWKAIFTFARLKKWVNNSQDKKKILADSNPTHVSMPARAVASAASAAGAGAGAADYGNYKNQSLIVSAYFKEYFENKPTNEFPNKEFPYYLYAIENLMQDFAIEYGFFIMQNAQIFSSELGLAYQLLHTIPKEHAQYKEINFQLYKLICIVSELPLEELKKQASFILKLQSNESGEGLSEEDIHNKMLTNWDSRSRKAILPGFKRKLALDLTPSAPAAKAAAAAAASFTVDPAVAVSFTVAPAAAAPAAQAPETDSAPPAKKQKRN